MSQFAPLWTRDAYQVTESLADVLLVCFSQGPLREDLPLEAARFGIPSRESVDLLDVRRQERRTNSEVFDGWRVDPLRTVAERDLGEDLAWLDAADECHMIRVKTRDLANLGYLQASWGVARWMCARGATVVLDGHAARFWKGEDVAGWPLGTEVDIRREVSFVFETDATFGEDGHYVHTRGMVKLGRPDVVAVCGTDDAPVVVEIMKELAHGMARGLVPSSTRDGVALTEHLKLFLGDPTPEVDVGRLNLNNDATLLSLADGASLRGLVEKLRVAKSDG
jgi:hypothetical protein